MIRPDSGQIEIGGQPATLRSSADALAAGIGMVQQHFSLIGKLTVAENLILGRGSSGFTARWMRRLDLDAASRRAVELSERLGFGIDPSARCETLSVGARQKVEILKALWGGATTLVLDEPTAALSPPDAEELYALLQNLQREGTTIVLISHKMPEIMRLCDRVTVLRGRRGCRRSRGPAQFRRPGRAADTRGATGPADDRPQPAGSAIAIEPHLADRSVSAQAHRRRALRSGRPRRPWR